MEKLVIGKVIKMPCMRRGVCAYPEQNVNLLVTQGVLERMAKSAHGIPVIIQHTDNKTLAENIEALAVGRVADFHYLPESDLWYAHFIVDTQEAVELLENGWGVSTSYVRDIDGAGGTYNAVKYDIELLDGHYTHLAIVKTPRYEMARNPEFYNSADIATRAGSIDDSNTSNKGKTMLGKIGKIFRTVRNEIMNSADEMYLEIDGKERKLSDVVNELSAFEKKKEDNAAPRKTLNADDEIEYNGEKMSVNAFVERYNSLRNSADADKKDDKKDDDKADNAAVADDKKDDDKKDDDKKNDNAAPVVDNAAPVESEADVKARFEAMNNAAHSGVQVDNGADYKLVSERVAEGKARYGSQR